MSIPAQGESKEQGALHIIRLPNDHVEVGSDRKVCKSLGYKFLESATINKFKNHTAIGCSRCNKTDQPAIILYIH